MSEDRIDQQEERNYGRRSRKDEEGRDYVCGCGKSYLSYPALYTHIKTKHDGLKPEGTLKVSPTSTTRKISTNATPTPSDPIPQTLPTPPLPPPPQPIPTPILKSRLPLQLLHTLQQLTSISDFQFATYLTQLNQNVSGFTPPDDRLLLDKVGECIYEKYMEIVEFNKEKNKDEEFRVEKLGYRSQLEYAMVVYLLGAGRYVCGEVMEYYMEFCRLFKECFTDHGTQVYEVCFKSKQVQQQKQRQHQRQRDDPYKHYQYSYPPSSSKSKSYLAHISSTTTPHSLSPNIIIVPTECKYSPIVCDFFARVFVPSFVKKESERSMLMLICVDFCGWMVRSRISVVDVGLIGRYQVKGKEEVREELGRILGKAGQQDNSLIVAIEPKGKKSSPTKQKQKRPQKQKQKPQKPKKQPKQSTSNPSLNPNPSPSPSKHPQPQQPSYPNQSSPQPSPSAEPEPDHSSQLSNHSNNDQDSYKMRHEIENQMGVRDRSGSIHHYGHILGDNVGEVQGEVQVEGVRNGHDIDQEEIQQYINP